MFYPRRGHRGLPTLLTLSLGLGTVVLPALAHAQTAPPPTTPTTAAAPAISEEARTHFKAGVALLQDPEGERVEEAYREFKAAYAISKSPKMLGNMGFCAMRLERDGEALEAYTQYLREVPDIDNDERAQITRDVQTLGVGVVRVTLKVNAPAGTKVIVTDVRTPVRGDKVTNTYAVEVPAGATSASLTMGIRSGHHAFTARAPGLTDEPFEVDALSGSKESRELTLKAPKPADPVPPPARTLTNDAPKTESGSIVPWVVAGVGGAMMIAGAVTGVVALGKESDIKDACPNDRCPSSFDLAGAQSSAKTMIGVTDVLLIGGGVVAAAGLTWGFLSLGSTPKAATTPAGPTGPVLSPPPFGSRGTTRDQASTRAPMFSVPAFSASCGPTGCMGAAKVVF